jgi:hypothetical protein
MKKLTTILFPAMGKVQIESLTTIIKETIATGTGYSQAPAKQFTAADLWNIQRQKKNLAVRRFSI